MDDKAAVAMLGRCKSGAVREVTYKDGSKRTQVEIFQTVYVHGRSLEELLDELAQVQGPFEESRLETDEDSINIFGWRRATDEDCLEMLEKQRVDLDRAERATRDVIERMVKEHPDLVREVLGDDR